MRNNAEGYARATTVPPAYMFNLLRAAYGARNAENIFREHGINPPATILHSVQKSLMAC
jgi:hypothetical protein